MWELNSKNANKILLCKNLIFLLIALENEIFLRKKAVLNNFKFIDNFNAKFWNFIHNSRALPDLKILPRPSKIGAI